MIIVGVGCAPGLLTERAIEVITRATHIYGSDRAIEIARPFIPVSCDVKTIDDYKRLHTLPEGAVVLSTGDPMLAGLGYLPGEVVPGISSLQLAAARLHIPLARVAVVVAHGNGHESSREETVAELKRNRIVFLLTDPKFEFSRLYAILGPLPRPLGIAVCENLGYPNERITTGAPESPPLPESALYVLVIGNF
jgi:cobalt-precorrin-7 (C5)-methyltransferase